MPTKKRNTKATAKRKPSTSSTANVQKFRRDLQKVKSELKTLKAKLTANNKSWQQKVKDLKADHQKQIEIAKANAFQSAIDEIVRQSEQATKSHIRTIELAINKVHKQSTKKLAQKLRAKTKVKASVKKKAAPAKKKTTAKKKVAKTTAKKRTTAVRKKATVSKFPKRRVAKRTTTRRKAA